MTYLKILVFIVIVGCDHIGQYAILGDVAIDFDGVTLNRAPGGYGKKVLPRGFCKHCRIGATILPEISSLNIALDNEGFVKANCGIPAQAQFLRVSLKTDLDRIPV